MASSAVKRPFEGDDVRPVKRLTIGGLAQPTSPAELFEVLGREGYMQQRVHRRLHAQAAELSDEELRELGLMSFNLQFGYFENPGLVQPATPDIFQGLSREAYTEQRVHRKLHAQAASLSDEELYELGRLSFNEQFPALGVVGPSAAAQHQQGAFLGLSREQYMQQRVHRRLHAQAASLSDQELMDLGQLSFNDQFPLMEERALQGHGQARIVAPPPRSIAKPTDPFGGAGRDVYMQQRVHRKLHASAAALGDEDLLELGKMSFNEQFGVFGEGPPPAQEEPGQFHTPGTFGGLTREQYMHQRVHRKLHSQAAALSDEELHELGKKSFNEQFPALGMDNAPSGTPRAHDEGTKYKPPDLSIKSHDVFGGLSRETFMKQRVHRKLHLHADCLGDEELRELGDKTFNEQFTTLGLDSATLGSPRVLEDPTPQKPPDVVPKPPDLSIKTTDVFGGLSREQYMYQRVHRKLHVHAAALSDEELHDLGKKSFNEQFPALGVGAEQGPQGGGGPPPKSQLEDLFAGLGREGYMQQRVHRRLHAQAATISDEHLLELGKLSFHDQFPALQRLEQQGAAAPQVRYSQGGAYVQRAANEIFGSLTREQYMHQRVHRRLHSHAVSLSDESLYELGKLNFHDQFPAMGVDDEAGGAGNGQARGTPRPQPGDMFGGMDRQQYMQQRVHRKLHQHCIALSDDELFEFGKLSFNEQFPFLERKTGLHLDAGAQLQLGSTTVKQPSSDLFGGISREQYMQQRVHRRLHAQATALNDEELAELGKMNFNQQFPIFEQMGLEVAGA